MEIVLDKRTHLLVLVVALGLAGVVDCRSQGDVGEMIEQAYLARAQTRQNGSTKRSLMATREEAKRRKSGTPQASAVGVCQRVLKRK